MTSSSIVSTHPALTSFLLGLHLSFGCVADASAEGAAFDYCSDIMQSETYLLAAPAEPEIGNAISATEADADVERELHCLALNIYFEARGEPEQGQIAVGHVVMNRVADRHYPDTICEVVMQGKESPLNRCQFSWWCDGRSDKPANQKAWKNALHLAESIFSGASEDPTNGALWYHAEYVNPAWSNVYTLVKKIGQHSFYLNRQASEYALN